MSLLLSAPLPSLRSKRSRESKNSPKLSLKSKSNSNDPNDKPTLRVYDPSIEHVIKTPNLSRANSPTSSSKFLNSEESNPSKMYKSNLDSRSAYSIPPSQYPTRSVSPDSSSSSTRQSRESTPTREKISEIYAAVESLQGRSLIKSGERDQWYEDRIVAMGGKRSKKPLIPKSVRPPPPKLSNKEKKKTKRKLRKSNNLKRKVKFK